MSTLPYKTTGQLEAIVQANSVFITAIPIEGIKPKRQQLARSLYVDIYDIQLEIIKTVGLIEVSQILAENEIIVTHIVNEYSQLKSLSTELTKRLKAMSQFSEYKDFIESINKANKVSVLGTMLFDDLSVIAHNKLVDIDMSQQMGLFKSST